MVNVYAAAHAKRRDRPLPRIDAPTVAEHHLMRRGALLAAGIEILGTAGPTGLTHSALGDAAGIARTSVYQYFPSRDELVDAVIDHAFSLASAHLSATVEQAGSPIDRVAAYVTHAAARASDATHRVFAAIPGDRLSPAQEERLANLHRAALAPLRDALTELGGADPSLTASLVDAMVQAASKHILAGGDPASVTAALVSAVVDGPLAVS
jgi:AcrR family transcriptional regulator